MDNFTLFLITAIVLQFILIWYKNGVIKTLSTEIDENKIEIKEQIKEKQYYYKLAKYLWDEYRPYEIFPSKFARNIDEMSKWS
ncbi:MAG: hypothetical protein K0Q53_126 [Massilibacillus sp.]|jgi:hypothetical protein|nr:hypothetical protein [Massilibacillus sp.]